MLGINVRATNTATPFDAAYIGPWRDVQLATGEQSVCIGTAVNNLDLAIGVNGNGSRVLAVDVGS